MTAARFVPNSRSLATLRRAAATCRGCHLYKDATQTVFGEGAVRAKLFFIGEQPGDSEDRLGHPFVGPAGKLLHKALGDAGIAERDAYFTNVVKHFKYVLRGKRRIHATPKSLEIEACTPWLVAELRAVRPKLVVTLGATAAKALLGSKFRLTQERGRLVSAEIAPRIIATMHPSAILRAPSGEARRESLALFIDDLRTIAKVAYDGGVPPCRKGREVA